VDDPFLRYMIAREREEEKRIKRTIVVLWICTAVVGICAAVRVVLLFLP
jgi:hypothetical protein